MASFTLCVVSLSLNQKTLKNLHGDSIKFSIEEEERVTCVTCMLDDLGKGAGWFRSMKLTSALLPVGR